MWVVSTCDEKFIFFGVRGGRGLDTYSEGGWDARKIVGNKLTSSTLDIGRLAKLVATRELVWGEAM